jgi:hypothetical protein
MITERNKRPGPWMCWKSQWKVMEVCSKLRWLKPALTISLSALTGNSTFTLRIVGGGVQTGSTRHRGHLLSYCACTGWLWGWRIIRWNKDWQGKPKYSEKTCPSATLSATNPIWPDPGSNPGRRGGKSATNRLRYGAACVYLRQNRNWAYNWGVSFSAI